MLTNGTIASKSAGVRTMMSAEGSTCDSSALSISIHLMRVPALRAFIHSMSLKETSLLGIKER